MLLAWGADDLVIPLYHHRAVAGLLTGPHLVEIAGAGHLPFRYTEERWRHLLTAR